MNRVIVCLVGLTVLACVQSADATTYGGVEFPGGAASFADAVVAFTPGPNTASPYNNPAAGLGVPGDLLGLGTSHLSLGWGGNVVVQFTDNSLTTSGDSALDLWVFEVGSAVEPTNVAISTNGVDWIPVGRVAGATSGIDIDAFIGSGVTLWEQYSYVKLTDTDVRYSGQPFAGADIDAIGAISSAPPVPEPLTCLGVFAGLTVVGGYIRRRLA